MNGALFWLGLGLAGALSGLAVGLAPVDSGVSVFLLSGGIALAVSTLLMALWFRPTLKLSRTLRQAHPQGVVFTGQKTPDTEHGLRRIAGSPLPARVPSYLVVLADARGIQYWCTDLTEPLATVSSAQFLSATVGPASASPASTLTVLASLNDARVHVPLVPSRTGSEFFRADLRESRSIADRIGSVVVKKTP